MKAAAAIPERVRRQDGQVLALVAACLVVLIGFAAIVFDIGRAYVAQQQLKSAVNSAALAAGLNLPNATSAYNAAVSYSGATGAKNALGGSGIGVSPPTVTFECISHAPNYNSASGSCPTDTSSTNCQPSGAQSPQPSGATTCNAIRVKETVTVPMTLGSMFFPNFTISASATVAARGGTAHPINAYVILDNTQSMTNGCGGSVTGISSPELVDCAKAGLRALLQALWPCNSSAVSCGTATANGAAADGTPQLGANVAAPIDEVGLLVFPAIKVSSPASSTPVGDEVDCKSNDSFGDTYPTYTSYTYNSAQADGGIPSSDAYLGYQAVGLSSDYRPSVANTTLSWTTSNLVEAADWGQCSPKTYPGGDYYGLKIIGNQGSYLAGAITEAQHLLNQNARPGTQNVIIVESDGQMNHPKTFTDNNPCHSAINAATQAKAAGTLVYSIAYGANGTGCPDTNYSTTDLQTMGTIASSSETFFNSPTSGGLTADFQQVATDLTDARLIPDCTAAPPAC